MGDPIKPELKDRVAIVTGSARGVGKVIALLLAEYGAHLVLVGRNAAALEDLADTIEQGGRRAAIIRCDVTKGDEVKQMVAKAEAFAGRIDILVNVVGGTRSLSCADLGNIGEGLHRRRRAKFDSLLSDNGGRAAEDDRTALGADHKYRRHFWPAWPGRTSRL